MRADAPPADVLEVSVFSRGHGEAVAVHVGKGVWVLIDTFLVEDKKPVSLAYLAGCGVDARAAVDAILLTHWHADHIGGAARMADVCSGARVTVPGVFFKPEFQALFHEANGSKGRFCNALREFKALLSLLRDQRRALRHGSAGADISGLGAPGLYRFDALSPSDHDRDQMIEDLRAWLTEGTGPVGGSERNGASVASVLTVGAEMVLFGADLEVRGQASGWRCVYQDSWRQRGLASVFKVPHHGSANAHYPETWAHMLVQDAISVLTPWNFGGKLPTEGDVRRIMDMTRNAYAAAPARRGRAHRRIASVEHEMQSLHYGIGRPRRNVGQVRLRKAPGKPWDIDLSGDACSLTDYLEGLERAPRQVRP